MPLHLIIDGYNLIRQIPELARHEKKDLEQGRQMLLKSLASYRRTKNHAITVVFDGWGKGNVFESHGSAGGIEVTFSRQGEKADEVIKRLAAQKKGEVTVVTSDRELGYSCLREGCAVISAPEFYARMVFAQEMDQKGEKEGKEEPAFHSKGTKKKGPAKRPPKSSRHHQAFLKKL